MTPVDDPRPLHLVLTDWLARHGLSAYAAAPNLGQPKRAVQRWAKGSHRCLSELAVRRAMAAHDAAHKMEG